MAVLTSATSSCHRTPLPPEWTPSGDTPWVVHMLQNCGARHHHCVAAHTFHSPCSHPPPSNSCPYAAPQHLKNAPQAQSLGTPSACPSWVPSRQASRRAPCKRPAGAWPAIGGQKAKMSWRQAMPAGSLGPAKPPAFKLLYTCAAEAFQHSGAQHAMRNGMGCWTVDGTHPSWRLLHHHLEAHLVSFFDTPSPRCPPKSCT